MITTSPELSGLAETPDELNKAYDLCTGILAQEPARHDLWYLRSQIVAKNAGCVGKLHFAIRDVEQALVSSPDNREYLISLQDHLRRADRVADRLRVLRRLAGLDGDDSVFAAAAAAVEEERNDKMAVLRWAESHPLDENSVLDPGTWTMDQLAELSAEIPAKQFDTLCRSFVAGRAMSEYQHIVEEFAKRAGIQLKHVSIQADLASRTHRRPRELLRHANVVPDGPFNFVLVEHGEHAIASAGFAFCYADGKVEIVVHQLQGTAGSQQTLGGLRWEHLLLSTIERFAADHDCAAVRIQSAETNSWVQRMHQWLIERGVIAEDVPVKALFEPGDLTDKAREEWQSWQEEESRHPYFTRYIGFVDPRTMLLRYDKTARRRHYRLCEEHDAGMKYWRKAVTP
jgi:hypothetical protein